MAEIMWNDKLNRRRCELIDKEIYDGLTEDEAVELKALQEQMLAYRDKVAPLPLKQTQELLDSLKKEIENEQADQ